MTINYQQIFPAAPLDKYIRYFWVLESDRSDVYKKKFRILPDGSPGLVFQQNPASFFQSNNKSLPQCFIYGQTTTYCENETKASFRNIGVYFRATGLKSIFGIDACELTDRNIDINDLIKTEINNQLLNANTLTGQIELISGFLLKQAAQRNTADEKAKHASILIQKGNSLKSVQSHFNISERTLERIFKQHIGIAPKLFARICRFQAALNDLRSCDYGNLTDLTYKHDYFDQSHLIRDFKAFSGTTPKHFLLQATEQVENFPEWES